VDAFAAADDARQYVSASGQRRPRRAQRNHDLHVQAVEPGESGHTFTAENPLVTAENWDWELELGRRIDHILVRCSDHGPTLDIRACERIFDEPVDGVWGSDHFGVVADLSVQISAGRPVQ
jgi:endonuclease/exonuclease/phosphatase family metal-dependent hydrolase